jgi:hypothetical protein
MKYVYMVALYTLKKGGEIGLSRLTSHLNSLMNEANLTKIEQDLCAQEDMSNAIVINFELLRVEDA